MSDLRNEASEYVYELLMDQKHRCHGVYEVGKGGIGSCYVDPKSVYAAALQTDSPAFSLVHNHPSGDPTPSSDDKLLAERIQRGSAAIGLDFLDFIVIGDHRYYSFHEMGLMPRRTT